MPIHKLTTAEIELGKRRRRDQERTIQAARAMPAVRLLRQTRAVGVVILAGGDEKYFIDGVKAKVGGSNVLDIDSSETIQGDDLGPVHAQNKIDEIRDFRRSRASKGILLLYNYSFADRTSTGTPAITERIADIMPHDDEQIAKGFGHDQCGVSVYEGRRKPNNAVFDNLMRRLQTPEPAVLLVGQGDIHDLPAHPDYLRSSSLQHPIAKLTATRFGFGEDRELTCSAGIETYGATALEIARLGQPEVAVEGIGNFPINLELGNFRPNQLG